MNHIEFLIKQARGHWANYMPLPLDLFAQMNAAGIDVDAEERNYFSEIE